jgi:phage terminase large subunit-like protein
MTEQPEEELPQDWRTLGPEAKEALLRRLRAQYITKGLGGPRKWRSQARPKQLPPDDAGHWLADSNGFTCGCGGPDDGWNIWMFLAGRGTGKTWAGSQWIIEQAFRHPESVWAVVAPTFRDVRVTCFEGSSGIRKQLEAGEELQWRRNELRLDLINGSIIYGYSADQPERLRGSNLWGAWCLAQGSKVSTLRGDIPIEQVCAGDYALTRSGWRKIVAQRLTKRMTPVMEVTNSDGRKLRCTPDHKIFADGAWCDAEQLRPGATLLSCLRNSSKDHLLGVTGKVSAGTMTTRWAATGAVPVSCWPSLSGAGTMVLSRTDLKFITGITTESTTISRTWNSQKYTSTGKSTAPKTDQRRTRQRSRQSAWLEHLLSGLRESRNSVYARTAVSSMRAVPHTPDSVIRTAGLHSTVVRTVKDSGWSDVYDLTIEGEHEFFANGMLVHNCDEMSSWNYEETWYEGLVPALRIGSHPRVLITTTPRPTRLIRDLWGRRDGTVHITTASTWENAANLSAAALDELRRRYEGTRLGRQELEGELLEDLEGALWRRSDIDAARVKPGEVPDLTRVVVAIDPAVTSGEESDETGIVVAGDDGRGHGYILADWSMTGTPEQCMRKAVQAYNHYRADCIVAEVNNGGDFVGSVLRAVDPDIPYHQVRASRGKAIRAEPGSALAEQRRLHHVGSFPELEDQMCAMIPGISAGPDDRVDAAVWAITELRGLSQASWLTAYGAQRCLVCEHAYPASLKACSRCGTENPAEADRDSPGDEAGQEPGPAPETEDRAAGGWAAVYRLRRCSNGHAYSETLTGGCPKCKSGALGYLRQHGKIVGR